MTATDTANQKAACPDWAQEQLLKLRAIEINLGNIPDQQNFIAKDMRQLMNSLLQHDDVHAADSDFADLLFSLFLSLFLSRERERSSGLDDDELELEEESLRFCLCFLFLSLLSFLFLCLSSELLFPEVDFLRLMLLCFFLRS